MTSQHLSAHTRSRFARSRLGVAHVDERHDQELTVVGNHLAQHPDLSLTAIGLATHIQSLPEGARVGIKVLAAKFPEGETRIASAVRELEEHGYLSRTKERLPSGQIVTRTVSYNKPRKCTVRVVPAPRREPAPDLKEPEHPVPVPDPVPSAPDLPAHRVARTVLAGLRTHDPRLHLAERDVRRLAPAVVAWLERGVAPDDVQRTLASGLPPEGVRHPAGFLAHRLTTLLPPSFDPFDSGREAARPAPLQNCDGCDRAFRSPGPGRCRDCRVGAEAA
ncbi:helix-turn-helix domain-containing protein [Streptomyces sp. YU58]|uniref:helix-turn-helix domain-containing protein n=1 Tax=Streptomyces sp. SX92 TaxID=3158972 RepID=UPI0027B944F5|nr:helix-turn-helix domain-containing protein [Streptomyces coralus]WLW54278.1 helix-turn-helix domain-containing protein [Streptomyces coralus]